VSVSDFLSFMKINSKPTQQLRETWIKECDSRTEALKRGDIQLVDGPSAMKKLRQKFEK
jgi:hypothetical protein